MNYKVVYKELAHCGDPVGRNVCLECEDWNAAVRMFELAKKEMYDTVEGVRIVTDQGITKRSTNLMVEDCFDKGGNFKAGYKPNTKIDTIEQQNIDDALFDEDGNAKMYDKDIELFITLNHCGALSDIAAYYYSTRFDNITNGNYNSITMWR